MSTAQLAITFGSATNPRSIPNAHRDGYVVVSADTYTEAREMIFALTQGNFAFDYEINEFLARDDTVGYYPLGELGRVVDGIYTPR